MSHVKVLSSNMRGLVIRTIGAVQSAFSFFSCFPVVSLCILFIAIFQLLYRSCWVLIGLLPLCSPIPLFFCLCLVIITVTLVICSLNVRGLSNPLKRRETFQWLKMKNYGFFFKRSIALRKRNPFGRQSGVSPLFLTVFPVQAPVSVYYLTIAFNSKESDNILIKKGDLLLIIDVKTDNKVITLGKNVPPIKTSLPWKTPLPKTSVLSRKFAKKLSRSSSKERLPRQ